MFLIKYNYFLKYIENWNTFPIIREKYKDLRYIKYERKGIRVSAQYSRRNISA